MKKRGSRKRLKKEETQSTWFLDQHVKGINESKVFAGIMIILLNVATKFVPIRVSKSMEAFLRYTFSRNVLVFAICWVGTRDIIISLCITLIFILLMDYLLNEESYFCILPESFINHHVAIAEQKQQEQSLEQQQQQQQAMGGQQSQPVSST